MVFFGSPTSISLRDWHRFLRLNILSWSTIWDLSSMCWASYEIVAAGFYCNRLYDFGTFWLAKSVVAHPKIFSEQGLLANFLCLFRAKWRHNVKKHFKGLRSEGFIGCKCLNFVGYAFSSSNDERIFQTRWWLIQTDGRVWCHSLPSRWGHPEEAGSEHAWPRRCGDAGALELLAPCVVIVIVLSSSPSFPLLRFASSSGVIILKLLP